MEEKLKNVIGDYEELQHKYSSLSVAYEALLNEKGGEGKVTEAPDTPTFSDEWTFSGPGFSEKVRSAEDGTSGVVFSIGSLDGNEI